MPVQLVVNRMLIEARREADPGKRLERLVLTRWTRNFCSGRKLRVRVGESVSGVKAVGGASDIGVPQGSSSGPAHPVSTVCYNS